MKKISSYSIALSGMSCALATIFLVIAIFIPVAKIAMYSIAGLCVSLPLTKNLWASGILAYVVSCIIGFIVGNINAIPYIVFFGAYAIILPLLDVKFYKWNKIPLWLCITIIAIIKTGYYLLAFYLAFTLMKIVIGDIALFGWKWSFWLLAGMGYIAFILYDIVYRFTFKNLTVFVEKYIKTRR